MGIGKGYFSFGFTVNDTFALDFLFVCHRDWLHSIAKSRLTRKPDSGLIVRLCDLSGP